MVLDVSYTIEINLSENKNQCGTKLFCIEALNTGKIFTLILQTKKFCIVVHGPFVHKRHTRIYFLDAVAVLSDVRVTHLEKHKICLFLGLTTALLPSCTLYIACFHNVYMYISLFFCLLIHTCNLLRTMKKAKSGKRFPLSVFFIVGNEFCERFSYYGMKGMYIYCAFVA